MSDISVDAWWNEPGHTVAMLLRTVSSALGGDLAVWSRVDANGHVAVVDLVDAEPSAHERANRVRFGEFPAPAPLSASVARSGQPLLIPRFDQWSHPAGVLAEPWHDYLAENPVVGLIAVPVTLDDGAVGVLITARRATIRPYSPEDLRVVQSAAGRLAGRLGDSADADETDTSDRLLKRQLTRPDHRIRMIEILVGAGPPAIITAILLPVNDATPYRPGTLLVLACLVAAIFGGVRAAALSATSGTVALWWAFTPPARSWAIAGGADLLGLGIFVAVSVGVILLVLRLDDARSLEHLEHQLSDTLLEQSPVAMAVFDRDLRFRRVNTPMAQMNGQPAAAHIGRKPTDLNVLTGQLYEHLLVKVRDTGTPLVDHELSISMPEVGLERHWRASLQPLRNHRAVVVGVGLAIADVTDEIVARRSAEHLFHLAESLSTAVDKQSVANSLSAFLLEAFRGRSAVAMCDGDELEILSVSGFRTTGDTQWDTRRFALTEHNPMTDAVLNNVTVSLADGLQFDELYPHLASQRSSDWDRASLSMPLRGDTPGSTIGVMYVGWATARPITETVTTLIGIVSSLVSLAFARIAATNLAHQNEFRRALEAMLDSVSIGRALRDADGTIVDFVIDFANSRSVDGSPLDGNTIAGRRLSEVSPHWRVTGLFDRFCAVVDTGEPYQVERLRYFEPDKHGEAEVSYRRLQVAKFGDGYIAASRDVGDLVIAEQAALDLTLRIETERTAIELLQSAALPRVLPEMPGVRIAAAYQPADPLQPVGGDWYDAFTLDDNRVALVIADVAGHGRHAAVFMVQVRNVFRALAVEYVDPAEVLSRANNVTSGLNDVDGPFVTCCYAVLDVQSRTLRWAQAGHFSPLIVHANGESTYLDERPGPPLAFRADQHYESSTAALVSGDRVLMFTDGLVERRREHLDIGLTRLAGTAREFLALPRQDFVDALAASVTDRFDDLALLCVEVLAEP